MKSLFIILLLFSFSISYSQECDEKEIENDKAIPSFHLQYIGKTIKDRGDLEEKENNRKFEVALEKFKIAKKWTDKDQVNYLLEVISPELIEKTAANRAALVNDLLKIFKDSNETESEQEKCLLLSKMVAKLDEIVKYNAREWRETLAKISRDYKVATGNDLVFD